MAGGGGGGLIRRSDSIADMMPEALRQSRYHMKRCFQRYVSRGSRLMKKQQLTEELHRSADDDKDRLAEGFLGYVISSTHEAVVLPPHVVFAVRTNPGIWEYIKVHSADLTVDQITPSDYLKCKEVQCKVGYDLLHSIQVARRQLPGGGFRCPGPLHASPHAAFLHRQRHALGLQVHVFQTRRQQDEATARLPARPQPPGREPHGQRHHRHRQQAPDGAAPRRGLPHRPARQHAVPKV